MGYIPDDARWYLAEVILEHRVEGDPRNLVYTNMNLIEAESPEQAHAKALALGRSEEMEYENSDGRLVRVIFRGLRDLNVIHDPLEDGAELIYSEDVDVPEERLLRWVSSQEDIGVFAPRRVDRTLPNTLPIEFAWVRELDDEVEGDRPPPPHAD